MRIFALFDDFFLKFGIVGIINTAVGAAIIFLLYNVAQFAYWASSAYGYIITTILSFFLNKYFTFGVKQWSVCMIFAFIITIGLSYLIAYGVSKPVVSFILRDYSQRIRENAALFMGMCLFAGLNYPGQRLFVFKKREKEQGARLTADGSS